MNAIPHFWGHLWNRHLQIGAQLRIKASARPRQSNAELFVSPLVIIDEPAVLRRYETKLTQLEVRCCGLFRSPNLDTLILTTDIWSRAHGGCDRSAEDAYSSMAPDPTFAFVGGQWCPTLDFVIAFWIMIYVSHIVNFTILYSRLRAQRS